MNREELAAVMRGVPWVSLWAGPAPTVYNDEPDYLGMADAVLQHLASQRQEQGLGACDICWTVSWEPIPDEAECRLKHPHEKDHVRCAMCWMTAQATQVRAQAAAHAETIEDARVVCDKLAFQLADQKALVARLGEAIAKVLEGFDKGIFVRDVSHDGDSGWAIRALPYLAALGKLAELAPTTPTP